MLQLVIAALAGALLSLDSYAVGQFMFSRPLVAATLIGLIFGDPATGLLIGALLELVWIGKLPIGTKIPSDITLPAVTATLLGVELKAHGAVQPEVMAILLALPFGFLSSYLDRFNREAVTYFSGGVEGRLGAARGRIVPLAIALSLTARLASFFLVYFLVLWLQFKAVAGLMTIPAFYYEDALEAMSWLIPAVGTAAVLRRFAARRGWYFGGASFLAALLLIQLGVDSYLVLSLVLVAGALVLVNLRREKTNV